MVSLVSNKSILEASPQNSSFTSNRENRNEDLLVFGCAAINGLLQNLLANDSSRALIPEALLNRILLMMLSMESRKARETFTAGLHSVLGSSGILKSEVLGTIQNLNTVKRGTADVNLDYDKVLAALGTVGELAARGLNAAEACALLFNVLNLIKCDEYAVRDYSLHSIEKLIEHISPQTFLSCERWLLTQLKTNTNELVLKAVLTTVKKFCLQS